jgi:hypothetical protein
MRGPMCAEVQEIPTGSCGWTCGNTVEGFGYRGLGAGPPCAGEKRGSGLGCYIKVLREGIGVEEAQGLELVQPREHLAGRIGGKRAAVADEVEQRPIPDRDGAPVLECPGPGVRQAVDADSHCAAIVLRRRRGAAAEFAAPCNFLRLLLIRPSRSARA